MIARHAEAAVRTLPEEPDGGEAAVIDIGSNSVRMVLYRLEGRAVWTVFNEKVLAGLGRGMAATGRLSEKGVETALGALRRFRAVLDAVNPDSLVVVATAAVRLAADGEAFCRRVAEETGLQVRVLTGEEEARYAALGVLAGAPDSEGVAADLGGSSLELVRIGQGRTGDGVTLGLGPFALANGKTFDLARVERVIAERLAPSAPAFQAAELHAVGGGWRSLTLLHMQLSGYPLRIVHQYAMTAAEALDVARLVARQSKGSIERMRGVSRKRGETLPYAALVLEALIERCGFQTVHLSAWGLREGLLFEGLGPQVRSLDPLIAGCAALGARQGVTPSLPAALADWLGDLFETLPPVFGPARDRLLVAAACALADVGARLHPDHRADLAFAQVLRAPIPGQTHAERAFLACMINARYGGGAATPEPGIVKRLLAEDGRRRARALGLAIRLACDLSGRSPHLLARAAISLEKNRLRLVASPDYADLMLGEQTLRRAHALADALDVELELKPA